MLRQRRLASAAPCIESLESRRFMSASPVSHAHPAAVETHAAKPHKTIPAIVGTTYVSTVESLGRVFSLSFFFSTESAKGALQASILDHSAGTAVFPCTGTVNTAHAVSLKAISRVTGVKVTAKLSADLTKLTGKIVLHGPKLAATPFTATLYTPPSSEP